VGKRETILDEWQQSLEENKVNIQYNVAVVKIEGQQGDYVITSANIDIVNAEHIILGIGL
jgi:predicted flavoprotein YhiN